VKRKLVLENGYEFFGEGFGSEREAVAEIVFNTSMVGYQEIISDSSYFAQIVTMTYPLIGNYGVNDDDYENFGPKLSGLVVNEHQLNPSNFRFTQTLPEILSSFNIPGISSVDTRKITKIIRSTGTQLAVLTDAATDTQRALEKIRAYALPGDYLAGVSKNKIWYTRTPNFKYNIVAIDCGIKLNMIRLLKKRGCNVTCVPYSMPPAEIMRLKPDGIFISNGPGDPEQAPDVVKTVKALQGRVPIFGVCLGHQIIGLANGARTVKLKFGHRGANHPVKNLVTGKIEITAQNHSFAIEESSLKNTRLAATHVNLLDNTIEGAECAEDFIFGVQFHPESCPGPQDSEYLFDKFLDNVENFGRIHG